MFYRVAFLSLFRVCALAKSPERLDLALTFPGSYRIQVEHDISVIYTGVKVRYAVTVGKAKQQSDRKLEQIADFSQFFLSIPECRCRCLWK